MKTSVMLLVLVSGVLLASMPTAANTEAQPALVVGVESHDPQSNSNYTGPVDSTPQPQIYSYDIDIRVGSTMYRTSYDSAFGGPRHQSTNPGQSRKSRDACDPSWRPNGATGYRKSPRFGAPPAFGLKLSLRQIVRKLISGFENFENKSKKRARAW
jgi:hypothetical protein